MRQTEESPFDRALELACLVTIGVTLCSLLPALFIPFGLSAEGDALDYRVPILKWILHHHSYPNWSWTFVDDYPMLGELLMLPFFAIKQEFARIVPIAAYFCTAGFAASIGAELLPEEGRHRRALFLFLFASLLGLQPILVQAAHVMTDNVAAAFALAALFYLLRRRYDLSAALLAGALGTRYMIWGAAPGAALALWRLESTLPGRERSLKVVRYLGIASLGALPFAIRNGLVNGNPFFPLLNGLFHGQPLDVFEGWGRGKGPLALLLFPYDLLYTNSFVQEIFDTRSYTGGFYVYRLGTLFYGQLAACLLAFAYRPGPCLRALKIASVNPKLQAVLLFTLGHFLLWWYGSQQLRFLGCALAVVNALLLYPVFRIAPKGALAVLALLPLFAVGAVEQEVWKIALGKEESFRTSAYVQSAERCFSRSGVTRDSLVGFHDRNALIGYFDFDFVFLPGNNLAISTPSSPVPDFIYSGLDFHPVDGFEAWPREKPCILKRRL